MSWLKRYRLLIVVYAICVIVGVREYLLSHNQERFGWLTPEGRRLTNVIAQLNPTDPETEFLTSMQSLARGDEADFIRRIEEAIATDIKHNEMLLRFYAQYLLDQGADWQRINRALNRWRANHPFSNETIVLQLSKGPRTPEEEATLHEALAQVPWIAGAKLESQTGSGAEHWQVNLLFRRAQDVDIRQAFAALSVLSPVEAQPGATR